MTNKKVKLKIESATLGHETVSLAMSEAISRVDQEVNHRGKWLYCDGRYTAVDVATSDGKKRLADTLASATDVTLAGTLLGG